MRNKGPIQLDHRIHLIDGFDLDVQARTGTYVIDEAELTLVETGPSPSVKYVKRGLESLGFSLDDVKYIIVTHIHLDHSGDRKSTRLNSSHVAISYAVFCLKKKKKNDS